jgi:signal transduction histidine kinase
MVTDALPFYRRAVPLYVGTIVVPITVLLWLGVQSFERQQQAVATLTAEKLDAAVESETVAAATRALSDPPQPIAKFFFSLEDGVVTRPALHTRAPREAPAEFAEAERLELELNRPDLALASYRNLAANPRFTPLALSRVARVLSKLGQEEDARETWRRLANTFPDFRDLADRPFGIVASIHAGSTAGLAEQIVHGRWELAADQADFFLSALGRPAGTDRYLERFRFAEQLSTAFQPGRAVRKGEIDSYRFADHRVFYISDGAGRIDGLLVDPAWASALHRQKALELGVGDFRQSGKLLYAGALAVVLLVLSAGAFLLWRDVARQADVSRLRSDFVNGVSHELKTPITLVRLYGETLLRQPALREDERREFYRIITRESARLGRLVDQILSFSRLERGTMGYDLTEGDVAPVIAGVVDDYSEWLQQAGFVLTRAIPGETPPIRFDPAAISQAVINLLDNAVKYSGGARDIAVRLGSEGRHVSLEIRDRGMGIPREEQSRIFERFYRSPNGSGKGGYGLGLFMVRHIMDAHGGRAEVESEPGHGSTFRLVFPVAS